MSPLYLFSLSMVPHATPSGNIESLTGIGMAWRNPIDYSFFLSTPLFPCLSTSPCLTTLSFHLTVSPLCLSFYSLSHNSVYLSTSLSHHSVYLSTSPCLTTLSIFPPHCLTTLSIFPPHCLTTLSIFLSLSHVSLAFTLPPYISASDKIGNFKRAPIYASLMHRRS